MPHSKSIYVSISSLDGASLNRTRLDCMQLLTAKVHTERSMAFHTNYMVMGIEIQVTPARPLVNMDLNYLKRKKGGNLLLGGREGIEIFYNNKVNGVERHL